MNNDTHIGAWFTRNGAVRLELKPDGSYGKEVAGQASAYAGQYKKDGARLFFQSNTGKTVRGRIMNGVLTAGPHLYLREWPEEAARPQLQAQQHAGFAESLVRWASGRRHAMIE